MVWAFRGRESASSARVWPVTAGDARFVAAYESYYRSVYAYCFRRTAADKVDDAVADVFLVAWRRIGELPEGDQTLPWLYGVAYRVLGHQWRRVSRQRKLDRKLAAVGVETAEPAEDYIVTRHESRRSSTL